MERTDIVEAQLMTNSQLQAVRDKIVVDVLTLRDAVLSLYPNFNVDDQANMLELETNLRNAYPEINSALRVADLQDRINKRNNVEDNLRSKNSVSTDVVDIRINWEKVPANLNAFRTLKENTIKLVGYLIETERLRRVRNREMNS